MVQNPQFLINIRKNINANNPGYGKYYPKAVEKDTITLRGLAKHMAEHQCVYSRDIIEGVLIKMASCMIELIAQGNPVKIDGLGIFGGVDQGGHHQGSPAGGQVERQHLREGRSHPLPSRGRRRRQHHLALVQGAVRTRHLRRGGEGGHHARGDRPLEEEVHQEGDSAR